MLLFCPTCSNMLRVSKVPPGDPTIDDYVGQNRFECLTCPYHFVINKRYYERKYLKKKEVEDILGGKGAWDNVDKTQGQYLLAHTILVLVLTSPQSNVQTKSAATTRPTGTSCRFAVPTSP
jgi:DNA-directed RNA polymerase subunit M/transcription elongation factor TFIIS